ncbi:MAG: DinB family protein [Terriglobales bacterium]
METADSQVLVKTIRNALSGKGAHVETASAFAGLDWRLAAARPEKASHSVFQLLRHMIYWQDWVVEWLDGQSPATPRHASGSWPTETGPANARDWDRAVRHFRAGLRELNRRMGKPSLLEKPGSKTRLEMLHAIASHNSYHVGQAVILRRMLGAWPPPSGGLTW